MTHHEIHTLQEQPAIRLKPIVSYPREAKVGERYLFTIDVQLAEDSPWPYPEEEFEISFILETAPFFTHEPVGEHEPGLVLHRYGGTYGAAEYLLTASQKVVAPGKIRVTLLNGWGLFIAQLELECEVREDVQAMGKRTTRTVRTEQALSSSLAPSLLSTEDALLHKREQRELIVTQLSMVGWSVREVRDSTRGNVFPWRESGSGFFALQDYPSIKNYWLLLIKDMVVGIVKVHTEGEKVVDDPDDKALRELSERVGKNLSFGKFITSSNLPFHHIPFVYHVTDNEITFRNHLEPDQNSRKVYTFHQPIAFVAWLTATLDHKYGSFRTRLLSIPVLEQGTLFDYQYEALQCIEKSLAEGHVRTLIQLEPDRGKTYIATRSIYRLLEYANAKHILYIVDISNLKKYAFDAFKNYIIDGPTLFEQASFTDRYGVEIITNEKLDPSVHVYIGTFEVLYTLYASGPEGQRLPAPIPHNASSHTTSSLKDYCADLPIEYFDAIILAESGHIDHQRWQPVLDYFDTLYIGIASRASDEMLRFFNNHLVYPFIESIEEVQDKQGSISLVSRQELVTLLEKVRYLLEKDSGLSIAMNRLPLLPWLLLLKYLDDFELAQEKLMGDDYIPIIKPGYRWRDWVAAENPVQKLTGDALLKFVYNDLIPYLGRLSGENIHDIRTIVSTIFSGTFNIIRSGYVLREAVDKLNVINFNSSDDTRMIALYYEDMLKKMRDSVAESDDFYTPRPIVRFIIDCLKPQLGESLLDPTCGTAGFLVETYERLVGQVHTIEQRRQLQYDLIGIEKMPTPYLLTAMNMLLHGIEVPNIMQANALITNMQELYGEDYVDIIAADPPFGGQEERSTVGYFPQDMRTSETSLLFVQYIMQVLKQPGGRCGIVLPNSFLFGKGVASRIKNRLLTQFSLHTIVRLPRGAFAPYTSIPTNILFFESTEYLNSLGRATSTQEVWYYEFPPPKRRNSYTKVKPIQYEAFHDCLLWWDHREENEYAWKVPVEDLLANDCNLDVKNPRRI